MGDITIRPLTPDDLKIFRTMRLKALRMHPGYFMANPDEAQQLPDQHWLETLDGRGKQVFGLFDDDKLIGITGVFTWREDPAGQTGVMAMSFIEQPCRGKGYAGLLYQARIDFAIQHIPWKKLVISHRAGNEPSRKAITKHGFTFTDTKETHWPDGTSDTEYNYELDLVKLRS